MSRNSKTPRSLRSILLRDQGNLLPIPPGYTALGMSGGQMVMGKPDGSVQPLGGSAPAAIIRPFNLGDPNLIPMSMIVTGELTSDGTIEIPVPIVFGLGAVSAEGKPGYVTDSNTSAIEWDNSESRWQIYYVSETDDGVFADYHSFSDVALPSLADWGDSAQDTATGTPIVTAGPIFQGAFIGQQLRWEQATAGTFKWYIWNGATWSELALA
jgi:hypothetical protein